MSKVLIVEDEEVLLNALSEKFKREGFEAYEAVNGEVGLETAKKEHPDLILLDLLMPVMDGLAMLKELRELDNWGKQVPVIILTNLSPEGNIAIDNMAKYEPAYYFLKTDWKIDDLVEKVKSVINSQTNK